MARNLLVATFFACLAFTLASPEIDVRIAGGTEVFSAQFRYQVAIYFGVDGVIEPLADDFCSGSLISPNYVLTAARCLVNAQNATIVIGTHGLEEPEEGHVVSFSTDFIIPEDYVVSTVSEWDVGLIKLDAPVELTDKIQTVELAEGDDNYAGDVASVSGWGATYAAQFTVEPTLRWIESVILSYRQCIKNNNWYQQVVQPETHICQYSEMKGACRGDRGAPLIIDGILVGLAEYTPANCFRGHPVIFTRVAKYIDWIKENSDI